MSSKGDTNRKWTSSEKYRNNYDEIFRGPNYVMQKLTKLEEKIDSMSPQEVKDLFLPIPPESALSRSYNELVRNTHNEICDSFRIASSKLIGSK